MRLRAGAVRLALAGAIAWTGFAPIAGLVSVEEVRAAATDLTIVTDATYTPDPDARRIHVSVAITAANHVPDSKTRKFYFDAAYLAVQPGTAGFKISGVKGATVRVAKAAKDSTLLRIALGTKLLSGKSATYRLTFDILTTGKKANAQARAARGLITIPVWAFASTGARGSSATVSFPAGWEVNVESGSFDRHSLGDDGGVTLATGPLSSPLTWFAYVSAQQAAVYASAPLVIPAGDQEINLRLRSWVDDPTWATSTQDILTRALPALRAAIGIPWPHQDPTTITESVSRAAGGYAGVFDPSGLEISVAYWAAPLVTVHEAAHGWFHGSLLADRWAIEGFASLYATRVAGTLGLKGAAPALTDEMAADAIPLNAWPHVSNAPVTDPAQEAYGYAASLQLATLIAERAGDAALTRVWADAAAGVGAYQPPAGASGAGAGATPEGVAGAPDWRGLLDLLEAETGQDFTDLWRTWVLRPDELDQLETRAAARTAYEQTLAVADEWALPRQVRDALRAWRFDVAQRLMADARTVIAQRNALEATAEQEGLTLPGDMRRLFETGSLVEASAMAEQLRAAMVAITTAEASRTSTDDPLVRVGMWGADPEADLAAARTAITTGDPATAVVAADRAYHAWTDAWHEGRRRLLIVLGSIAAVLLLASAIGRLVRRARHAVMGTVEAR